MESEDRKRIRCRYCHIPQFVNKSKTCVKCHSLFSRERVPAPPLEPVVREAGEKVSDLWFWMAFVLSDLRRRQGIPCSELGKRLGVTRQYINKVEGDRCLPRPETLERYCAALNTTPSSVLRMSEYLTFGI